MLNAAITEKEKSAKLGTEVVSARFNVKSHVERYCNVMMQGNSNATYMQLNVKKKQVSKTVQANSKNGAKKAAKTAVKAKLVGERIALVSGAKGQVFRKGLLYSDGSFKLTQNNVGLKYDGALVGGDKSKWDKAARLEMGNYVCERGTRASVRFMTLDDARKLASKTIKFIRNGHDIKARYYAKGGITDQYIATIEKLKNGEHFFQLETEVGAGDSRELHYGQTERAE